MRGTGLGGPHRVDEVLVQVVDVLDRPAVLLAADGDEVEHRQVLDQLAQADAAGVRADRDANLAASNRIATFSFTPPTRQASICTTSRAPACISCLKITRFCTCSPVATRIGAMADRIAAWPRTSSGLVGSSTQ